MIGATKNHNKEFQKNRGAKMSTGTDFVERIRNNWQQRAGERTTFRDELRIISPWLVRVLLALYILAIAVVLCLSVFAPATVQIRPAPPPPLKIPALIGIVTGVAALASVFVLFYGYIWADAKRRGMSPVLWLVIALLVPSLLGVILYFVVREPLPFNCPQCGTTVNPHFNFCPGCQFNLRPNCPQCRRGTQIGDRFCPHCGFTLQTDVQSEEVAPTT